MYNLAHDVKEAQHDPGTSGKRQSVGVQLKQDDLPSYSALDEGAIEDASRVLLFSGLASIIAGSILFVDGMFVLFELLERGLHVLREPRIDQDPARRYIEDLALAIRIGYEVAEEFAS